MTEVTVVKVDPIAKLTSAFSGITTALEAHKTNSNALTTAKESEVRAEEALVAAQSRTTNAKVTDTSHAVSVVTAIDAAKETLTSVREIFAA